MSTDAGYVLIRVNLQGAQQAAAEAAALRGEIAGTGTAATTAGAASAASSKKTSRLTRAWGGMAKAAKLGALGLAGGAAAITVAGVKAVGQMQDLGLVAAGLHRNLGLASKEGSRWAAVAQARGVAPTALNMAFKTLSTNLQKAVDEGGTYADKFKLIGLTNKDLTHGMKDFDWFIQRVAQGFGDMKGGADRMSAASQLLGRGVQTILPLFASGSAGMEEQLKWADKYHIAMGKGMVDDLMDLKMAQRESQVAMLGLQKELAMAFLPVVQDAHKEFQDFAAVVTDPHLSDAQKFDYIGQKIEVVGDKIQKFILQMIPQIAERVGQAAPKIAVALWNGFVHANIWGKLVIGYWLTSKLVGGALLSKIAIAGGKLGMKLGSKLAESAILWMMGTKTGAGLLEFAEGGLLGKLRGPLGKSGRAAGRVFGMAFGVAAIAAAAWYIFKHRNQIQDVIDQLMPGWGGPDNEVAGDFFDHAKQTFDNVKGLLGFAGGTSAAPPGWHWVGERGPELMRFRGGEQVLSTQDSLAAVLAAASSPMPVATGSPRGAGGRAGGPTLVRPKQRLQPIVIQLNGKTLAKELVKMGEDADARK